MKAIALSGSIVAILSLAIAGMYFLDSSDSAKNRGEISAAQPGKGHVDGLNTQAVDKGTSSTVAQSEMQEEFPTEEDMAPTQDPWLKEFEPRQNEFMQKRRAQEEAPYDSDGDGDVDSDKVAEFLAKRKSRKQQEHDANLATLFKRYDQNADGNITVSEIQLVLKDFRYVNTSSDSGTQEEQRKSHFWQASLKHCDFDADQVLSISEMSVAMRMKRYALTSYDMHDRVCDFSMKFQN